VGTNYLPVTDCYAFGNVTVTSNSSTYTGGLAGININSTTNNCYAIGHVSGGVYAGGLVGDNSGVVTVATSYYNTETAGPPDNGIGEPRTTDQMKLVDTSVTTYSGWDFTTVWGISSGKNGGYPYLREVAP
jgi:hypothetical protein